MEKCDSCHRQHSCSSCELCSQADPEIIRGVSLHEALCSWGKHWKAENGGMPAADAANYELSRQVEAYDSFLSHDWGSGRLLKLLSLLLVFNSRAAFYACLFVSILVGFLRGFGVLPDATWTVVFGHATFFFVFAFWQRIRLLVCRPRMVFFDKLCVAQHDEASLGLTLAHLENHSRSLRPRIRQSSRNGTLAWSSRLVPCIHTLWLHIQNSFLKCLRSSAVEDVESVAITEHPKLNL